MATLTLRQRIKPTLYESPVVRALADVFVEEPTETNRKYPLNPDPVAGKAEARRFLHQFYIRISSWLFWANFLFGILEIGSVIAISIMAAYIGTKNDIQVTSVSGLPIWSDTENQFLPNLSYILSSPTAGILIRCPALISGIISLIKAFSIINDSLCIPSETVISTSAIGDRLYFKSSIKGGVFIFQLVERLTSGVLIIFTLANFVGVTSIFGSFHIVTLAVVVFVTEFNHEGLNSLVSFYHRIKPKIREKRVGLDGITTVPKLTNQTVKSAQTKESPKDTKSDSANGKPLKRETNYTFIFRSYAAFFMALLAHLWLWLHVLVYYGYGGSSNSIAWFNFRWAIVPAIAFAYLMEGLLIFVWTLNHEYEEDYIQKHMGQVIAEVKLNYSIQYQNNNFRLELALIILNALTVLTFTWVMYLGMIL